MKNSILQFAFVVVTFASFTACNPLTSQPITDPGFGALASPTPVPVATPIPFQFALQSAVIPGAASTIVIQFLSSAGGTIQPAASVTGFVVQVNGATAIVTSAARSNASEITITLAAMVSSSDVITVAYSAGNIIDSNGLSLPNFNALTVTNASAFDSDTVAYFNAITSNFGTISASTKTSIQVFVTSLKSASLWSKLIEIYPFSGDQLAAALIKLKVGSGTTALISNHGFLSGDYVATGTTGGLQGNGSKYLDTGLSVPGLARYDISFGSYVSVDGSNSYGFCVSMGSSYGATGDSDRFYIMGGGNSGTHGQPGLGNFYPNGILDGTGLRTVTYDGTTAFAYRNSAQGASQVTSGIAWQQPGTVLIYKGAGPFFHDGRIPLAFVGKALSQTDMTNLYAAIQAYETALGRNI